MIGSGLGGLSTAEPRHRLVHQRVGALTGQVLQHVGERLALDQFHGVVVAALFFSNGVHRHDVGVLELAHRADLVREASQHGGAARAGNAALDRDQAARSDLIAAPEPFRSKNIANQNLKSQLMLPTNR